MSILRGLIICLMGLSLSSFIKPGLLKKIARCELYVNQDKIVPGNIVDVTIATFLKDSSEILSSESNMDINFADYNFEIEGGATVYEKSRTAMKLLISDDHFMNPRIKLKISLRRKKTHKLYLNATDSI